MVNGVDGHTPQHIAGEVGEDVERIAVLEGDVLGLVEWSRSTTYDQAPGGSIQCSIDGIIQIDDRDVSEVPGSGADGSAFGKSNQACKTPERAQDCLQQH